MPPMPGAKLTATPTALLQVRSRDKEKVGSGKLRFANCDSEAKCALRLLTWSNDGCLHVSQCLWRVPE